MTTATTVTPYVMVHNAKQFVEFTTQVFGAEAANVLPLESDPERVVHGELRIGDTVLFFGDARMDGEQCLPPYRTGEDPRPTQMWVTVSDPAKVYDVAIANGATEVLPVADQGDGTEFGGLIDPFGTLWWLSSELPGRP